jgi:alpha,alpha-trehalase
MGNTNWSLVYEDYVPAKEGLREALCAVGNGYFVARGAALDARADDVHYPGTYLAGGYNRLVTEIDGRPIENEDLVNLPNWLPLQLKIGDSDWITPDNVEILSYRQELGLEEGVLHKIILFRDDQGRTTRWEERRFVSMAGRHLAAISLWVTPEDWSGHLTIRTALDGTVINAGVARYRALNSQHLVPVETQEPDGHTIYLKSRFKQAHLEVALAARTHLFVDGAQVSPSRRLEQTEDFIAQDIALEVKAGQRLRVEKIVALYTSRDRAISEAGHEARHRVGQAPTFDELLVMHRRAWSHLWGECGIAIDTKADHDIIMKLRLHIFHLLQTVSYQSVDQDVGVPARGWHGEAYRGHIFWDEIFILPFINFHMPELARSLLIYRYRRLPEARRAAAETGLRGALFPWQSGSSGREESQLMHLNPKSGRWVSDNTWRQRHINASVAYNVWHYYEVTGDHEFLYFYGGELLLEIARFWSSLATYNEQLDRYEIKGVMGPDEFHTAYPDRDAETDGGLDNNAYTNVMAAWLLSRALDVLDLLPDERRQKLCERIDVTPEEIERWDDISRKLLIRFHGDLIISQFEGYENLIHLDLNAARAKYGDIQRLDRILEAEGDDPNRYQVSKQADVLMLFYLFSAAELQQIFERLGYPFDSEMIPRTIDYYMDRTTHGSTLSFMVHSWVLARATRAGSWEMFCQTVDADVEDVQGGTTAEGIHLGAMAGSVDILQRCYTGIEPRANVLHFNPALPAPLERLQLRMQYRRQILDVEIDRDWLRVASRQFAGGRVTIGYRGQFRDVSPGQVYSFRLISGPRGDTTGAARA